MANHQTYIILFVLISAQFTFGKPGGFTLADLENLDELRNKDSALAKIKLFAIENFMLIPRQHAALAVNATQYMLKDPALTNNKQPEVLEFKNNLTRILDIYNASNPKIEPFYETMEVFANLSHHYLRLPEDQQTGQTKFIIELLNKYNCSKVAMSTTTYFEVFCQQFINMFEANKQDLGMVALKFYEHFKNTENLQKRIALIVDFMVGF